MCLPHWLWRIWILIWVCNRSFLSRKLKKIAMVIWTFFHGEGESMFIQLISWIMLYKKPSAISGWEMSMQCPLKVFKSQPQQSSELSFTRNWLIFVMLWRKNYIFQTIRKIRNLATKRVQRLFQGVFLHSLKVSPGYFMEFFLALYILPWHCKVSSWRIAADKNMNILFKSNILNSTVFEGKLQHSVLMYIN